MRVERLTRGKVDKERRSDSDREGKIMSLMLQKRLKPSSKKCTISKVTISAFLMEKLMGKISQTIFNADYFKKYER